MPGGEGAGLTGSVTHSVTVTVTVEAKAQSEIQLAQARQGERGVLTLGSAAMGDHGDGERSNCEELVGEHVVESDGEVWVRIG